MVLSSKRRRSSVGPSEESLPPTGDRSASKSIEGVDLVDEPSQNEADRQARLGLQVVKYNRVKPKKAKGRRLSEMWEVLIPVKGALFLLSGTSQRAGSKLCPLGAVYPSAELAARAADRALIAMSGRLASQGLLNWPLSNYPELENHQRFGTDLTRFMLGIRREGRWAMDDAILHALKRSVPCLPLLPDQSLKSNETKRLELETQLTQKNVAALLEKNPMYTFHLRPCGLCLHCRLPELRERCVRHALNSYNYNPRAHALLDAEGEERYAYRRAINSAKAKGDQSAYARLVTEMRAKFPLPDVTEDDFDILNTSYRGSTSAIGPNTNRETAKSAPGQATAPMGVGTDATQTRPNHLTWLIEPTKDTDSFRPWYRQQTRYARRKLCRELEKAVSVDISNVKRSVLDASRKTTWENPMGSKFPKPSRHSDILKSRELSLREASELVPIAADNPIWSRSADHRSLCTWCGSRAHGSKIKDCIFLQNTCAIATPGSIPTCTVCLDASSAKCSACLQGDLDLPAPVNMAPHGCRDVSAMVPASMQDLVLSLEDIASAAISEFDSPQLAGMLTPDAALAISLIAETLIDKELQSTRERWEGCST
jgi:hypothetical protein